jgi:transcriptional regulator with XRE-family HTH domain
MYEKFALLLKQSGISASKLAKEIGISAPSLTYWKQGKYTPQAKTIQAIANYFNVPISYFYSDTEYALGVTEQQAKSLGIDTEAVKQQLNAQLLDEQAIEIAKQIQKLDDTQKMAIEQIIKGLLQGKGKA